MSQVDSEERKNKAMKKFLIVLLAILFALPLAACSKDGNGGKVTDSGTESTDTDSGGSPVPDNLDYDNLVLNVGVRDRDDIAFELDPERNSVDKLVTAIENRNRYAENKLNLSLKLRKLPGTWAQRADFVTAIRNDAQAGGDDAIDILFGPNYSMVGLMLDGMFLNYYNSRYINLESSYWNGSFIDEVPMTESSICWREN